MFILLINKEYLLKEVKMAFKLKARIVTKEDEQELYKKYKKVFKKNLKQEDLEEAICLLFLDLIYLYFDNKKKKLYKLFFPVIMANFMELGSINSAIKEYRKKKKLFSESYTTRILRSLDENDSLEISRIFRKVLFKILKKNGFKNKGFIIAVDITAKPFYGNKRLHMVKGTKRKAGTNFAIQYLTASIVEEGVRFNLLCIPISSTTLVDRKVKQMISEIEKLVSIKLFYLDRGFASRGYSRIIKSSGYKFIMPITKNPKLKDIKFQIKKQSEILGVKEDEYTLSEIEYIFYEDQPIEYQEKVKLLALYEKKNNKDKKVFFFITNICGLSSENYYLLIESYRYRFGIETNYRVDNIFSALTSSVVASVRYLLMQISLIAQDLWALVNFLISDKKHQQPREKFKRNYSIISIIKARIKKLKFIWRPVITAVQFKRQMENVLG
jgi:putative transposase